MDEEAVEAGEQRQVGRLLEVAGVPGERRAVHTVGGKGFARNDILPVYVGHGGRFPDVCLVDGRRLRLRRPDCRHGDGCGAFGVHAVADEGAAGLMALGVSSLQPVLPDEFVHTVVIGGEEFADGLPPVK